MIEKRARLSWKTYSHTEKTGAIVREIEILVGKFGRAIDSARPGSITVDEVPSLDHEIFDLQKVVRWRV